MNTVAPNGSTPLDPDEAQGLIPTHITTMKELNEWEQANIVEAERWTFRRKRTEILSVSFVLELHNKMFDGTWKWAGKIRNTEKTVGISWWQIAESLAALCDDTRHWLDNAVFSIDEAAARFHHRLTYVHPFPNGNGRHARLMTDVLLVGRGRPRFRWGRSDLRRVGDSRDRYIAALRAADHHDFSLLFDFLALSAREE